MKRLWDCIGPSPCGCRIKEGWKCDGSPAAYDCRCRRKSAPRGRMRVWDEKAEEVEEQVVEKVA